jgi:peroxiredoxin
MALLDTPICDFGWQAPDFNLPDFDGVEHSMSEHSTDKGLLIAFICNHCPYVKAVAERLAEDADTLMAEGFGFLAVMSNDFEDYPADSPPQMKAFAAQHGFNFPYLVDESQHVGKAYGAVCTPDFFGFNCKGELQYRGRLDSAGMNDPAGRTAELVQAMRQIGETGAGPRSQIPSMGCSIKWR